MLAMILPLIMLRLPLVSHTLNECVHVRTGQTTPQMLLSLHCVPRQREDILMMAMGVSPANSDGCWTSYGLDHQENIVVIIICKMTKLWGCLHHLL